MVATIGMFDGVHLGHQALVADVCDVAKSHQMRSCVFTFDRHPLQTVAPERAPRLLTSPEQKQELLKLAGADRVVVLRFDESLRHLSARDFMQMLVKEYGVQILVMGFNHHFGHDRLKDFSAYQKLGEETGIAVMRAKELVLDTVVGTVSSSAIRRALSECHLDSANLMLGRPYTIVGAVEHGYRIGHKIGFPTANVRPLIDSQLIPANGVYAGRLNGMPAMVNIGTRPTFDNDTCRTIEAHILNYDGNLYEATVDLSFEHRLRDEKKFDSPEALRAQLAADKQQVLDLFLKK